MTAGLFHGGIFGFTDKLKFLGERGFSVMLDAENMPNRDRYETNGWGIDDQTLVDAGLEWLDGRSDPSRPSLAVYIPLHPHYDYFLPSKVERPFGERSLFLKYLNGLRYTDKLFGELIDAYEDRGILKDTLFIFVGDHGQAFQQHPGNQLHGLFTYEENLAVPLVLINRRLFQGGKVSRCLGSHADLVPTIFDALGLPVPDQSQGQSLLSEDYSYRSVFFATHYSRHLEGLRDGAFKFILNLSNGVEELYDLDADPREKLNIAAEKPDFTRFYRDYVQRFW